MKAYLLLIALLATGLTAEPVLYEGFRADGDPDVGRTGWMTGWHRLQGEVVLQEYGLGLPGLQGNQGALQLTKQGEGVVQIDAAVEGTYYGGFRIRVAELKEDSLLALVFAKPDLEGLTPNTAYTSIVVKGWRHDLGAVISEGKLAKSEAGIPIESKQVYLVLFKVENEESGPRSIQSWILNEQQQAYFNHLSFAEAELSAASLGAEASAVMQHVKLEPKKSTNLSLSRGDVVACMAKFTTKAVFDEIRVSKVSLKEAAGSKLP